MNYYNKYIKYKIKYLKLKYNNQYGGAPTGKMVFSNWKSDIIKKLKQQCSLLSYKYIPGDFQEGNLKDAYATFKDTYTTLVKNTIKSITEAEIDTKIVDILTHHEEEVKKLFNTIDYTFGQSDGRTSSISMYTQDMLKSCIMFTRETIHLAKTNILDKEKKNLDKETKNLDKETKNPEPDSLYSGSYIKTPQICIPNINGTFTTRQHCDYLKGYSGIS